MNILFSVILFLVFILVLLMLNKKIRIIAIRNLYRRKAQTLLIILGSMVGTAMITGSLGINDSMKFMLYAQTKQDIGEIDLVLYKDDFSQENSMFSKLNIPSEFHPSEISDFSDSIENSIYTDYVNNAFFINVNLYNGTNTIANMLNNDTVKLIAFDFNNPGIFSEFLSEGFRVVIDKEIFGNISIQELSISKPTGKTLEIFNKKKPLENFVVSEKELLTLNNLDRHGQPSRCIFMDMDYFYSLFPEYAGKMNLLLISNTGDWLNGRYLSPQIIDFYKHSNLDPSVFVIQEIKNNEIEAAGMANIGYVFLLLSCFSILSGLFLIINTFNMLAKERAKELGMLRAIGFLKKDIKQLFFLEGVFYTIFSSGLGVLCGILVSKFILGNITQYVFSLSNKFLDVIGNTLVNMADLPVFKFYISWDSVIISYLSGVIISLMTIYLFSRKISNFKIVNAVKGIEEEKESTSKLRNIICFLFIIFGIILMSYGYISEYLTLFYLGLSLFILPLSVFLFHHTKKKHIKLLFASILYNTPLVILLIASFVINVKLEDYPFQYLLLILEKSGVFILSLSILFMNNLVLLRKVLTGTFLSKIFKPYVLKLGIAYPENERRKTALMIAMYSLVIYIIVLVSVIPYTQQKGIERSKETIFWSYNAFIPDLFNTSSENLKKELSSKLFIEKVNELYASIITDDFETRQQVFYSDVGLQINSDIGEWVGSGSVNSIDDALLSMEENYNQYIILRSKSNDVAKIENIEDETSLNEDSELLGTFVFDNVTFFQGIVFNNPEVIENANTIKYLLVKVKGTTKEEIKNNKLLFRNFMEEKNLLAITDDDVIEISEVAITGMIQVLNGFLYFGMIIGIIGISITMYRAFLDRKKVIGMLKAIGFNGKEIFHTFLFETSIIVIVGLFIGILSGIITSSLVNALFSDIGAPGGNILSIPWIELGRTVLIFYIFSIISTLIPSFQASKLSPAEALKYYE